MNATTHADHTALEPRILPPQGLLLSLLAQIPLMALRWPLAPSRWELVAGGVLAVAGMGLNIWADRLFRRGAVGVCVFGPVPQLVSEGPFRVTRNPMYLGFVFLSAGAALLTGVLVNLSASLVLLGWLHFEFVLPEEAYLHTQLGQAYEMYRSSHARWIGINLP